MRVIVTRPRAQADAVVAALQARGVDAVVLPLIDIAPAADAQPVRRAWRTLDAHALVMFVSANAVQHFMRFRPDGAAWPARLLAGSTGPGTSAALRAAGVPAPCVVEPDGEVFDSEALWQRLRRRDWAGQRVLLVRGEDGRDWLAERLRAAGAEVVFVAAYRRCAPVLDEAGRALLAAAIARPQAHLWAISSSQAVAHLAALAPAADWSRARAVAPHPRIVDALRHLGFGSVHLAPADAASLAAAAGAADGDPPIQSGTP